ncbi:CCA tRNA nucleotidyltransferase [Lentibacillus sp. CBA3610]|uniref:CCA tRNA nucleotidyltransferase n=1 Tax=Lentibacillus sp. CBA3610 TaxID=2518176 RepID=UPI001595E1B3|nr:CCA tRNA nucleotidyltransferase [Lentibacillus sp. CBA3610]QKY71612.1 CCA tRNA nucleotidyltransferase [Lentibacillus sp. CBA3610]
MLLTKQFQEASDVLEQIERYGYDAYFVGGCVRDLLLRRKIGDIDIATSAPPDVIQQIFSKVIPVGLEHGTVIVRHNHQSYEVTTFRVDDDYSDQRHPDSVQFVQTIDQDLKRRDFTINALAMDRSGNIIDLFNGQEDIRNGIIRTVGNGYERFMEDPLRIIRALRFSSQLGFSLEEDTLDAMRAVSNEIETIAMERIVQETAKFFAGSYVNTGMYYFKMVNIVKHLPILQEHPHIIKRLPRELIPLTSFGAVMALLHFNEPGVTIQEWAGQWRCSNKIKYEAEALNEALVHYQHNGLDRCIVYRLYADCYSDFAALVKMLFDDTVTRDMMKQINHSLPIQSKKDIVINGMDLRRAFPDKTAGPWIGKALNEIEKQVVLGHLSNDKNALKEWIKWNLHETD